MAELDARIACTSETRAEIREMRGEGERYEDVLRRLLDNYQQND